MLLIRWSTYEPESGQFDETSQHHPVLPKQRPGLACPPREGAEPKGSRVRFSPVSTSNTALFRIAIDPGRAFR